MLKFNNILFIEIIILFFSFLSLGGVPPILGFIGKIIVIQAILIKMNLVLIIVLIVGSVIILFFYFCFIYKNITILPIINLNFNSEISIISRLITLRIIGR